MDSWDAKHEMEKIKQGRGEERECTWQSVSEVLEEGDAVLGGSRGGIAGSRDEQRGNGVIGRGRHGELRQSVTTEKGASQQP